jgi:uncharacterized protein
MAYSFEGRKASMEKFVVMEIESLLFDDRTKSPVVVLKPIDGEAGWILPIWIGAFEASALAMELENINLPRPFTHDLMRDVIKTLGGELVQIEIHSNIKGTYMANLIINQNGNTLTIDARPSDSIILALKCKAKIYANPELFQIVSKEERDIDPGEVEIEDEIGENDIGTRLRELRPEDFGRSG